MGSVLTRCKAFWSNLMCCSQSQPSSTYIPSIIQETNDGMWHIKSISDNTPEGYTVTRCKAASCDECTAMKCKCLCIHMYKCDENCYTFNNGYICKHIHQVHLHSQARPQDSTWNP